MSTSENKKQEPKAASTTKRDRSPNYPQLTFTEALERTMKIWEKDKRHPVSLDLASQHLGYKQKNGASLPILGALKRYGLLVSVGKEVKVSDEANELLLYPEGSPERVAIIKKLAVRPALFGEVLKRFPDGLPSDENLRARLQHEWNFASPKAADTFIKALREAVKLAGADAVSGGGDTEDNDAEINGEPHGSEPNQSAVKTTMSAISPIPPNQNRQPQPPVGYQTRPWDLGDGAIVTVILPNQLSKKNIARMKKYVEALATEASIAWDDEEEIANG